jgi:hypothetical protein
VRGPEPGGAEQDLAGAAGNPHTDWVVAGFGAAAVLNLLDAVVAPEGWAWTAARAAAGAAFLVAVILWVGFAWRRLRG